MIIVFVKRLIIILKLLLAIYLSGLYANAQNFIMDFEYGKLLYKNPRGIGCFNCHGDRGEGGLIAVYKEFDKNTKTFKEIELRAPSINTLSLQELADGISSPKDVMPTYFLTVDEIVAIYSYLQYELKAQKEKE